MQNAEHSLMGVVVVAAATLISGGCSVISTDTGPQAAHDALAITAEARVDPRGGQISLPLDRLLPTEQEWREIDYARDLLTARCAARQGVKFSFVDRREEAPGPSRRYGVWTESYARSYGHGVAPDPATAKRAEALNRQSVPAPEFRVIEACRATQELRRFDLGNIVEPQIAASDIYQQTLQSGEGRSTLAAWRRCIREAGYSPIVEDEGSPFVLGARAGGDSNSRAQLALADVKCKRTTRLVEVLASAEARRQWEFARRNAAAVNAQHRRLQFVLRETQRVR
ncbi:MAG: hypothetical protein ACRCYX_05635 [Dermatophilaceae bacterium]